MDVESLKKLNKNKKLVKKLGTHQSSNLKKLFFLRLESRIVNLIMPRLVLNKRMQ
jgi:hypothetical protein